MTAVDHRAILGLRPGADLAEVRRAYRKMARTHHPDHGGEAADMARINQAYRALLDQPKTPAPTPQPAASQRSTGDDWVVLESDPLWPEPVGWQGLFRYLLAIIAVPAFIACLVVVFFAVRYITS